MYLTNSNDNVARTKNQLLVVKDDEKEPDPKYIRGNPENYIITKILDKKIENKKTYYLTKFKGYNEPTWESSNIFNRTKDLKDMVKNFNLQH